MCNTIDSTNLAQAAWATALSLALALAHAPGVNSLIWVIFAAGNHVNKSFRYSKGLIPCRRQLPNKV